MAAAWTGCSKGWIEEQGERSEWGSKYVGEGKGKSTRCAERYTYDGGGGKEGLEEVGY